MPIHPRHLVVAGLSAATLTAAALILPRDSAAEGADGRATMVLNATVRDFRAAHEEGGHPDFQRWAGGVHLGLVASELGPGGKPVMQDRRGYRLLRPFLDDDGRPVNPMLFDDDDLEGGDMVDSDQPRLTSAERFAQWYTDVPGVNTASQLELVFHETAPGSGRFVFDSHGAETRSRNPWMQETALRGFFPIDGRGFGNYAGYNGGSTNYHFTTELVTTFTHREDAGYVFGFSGDDDLWVFIGGRLVIDLGGVHPIAEQWIDLDELDWLEDGETYSMHIFHAERRTVQSNFRVETTIPLRPLASIQTFEAYD
jgi:fibro-slime domain-containing protein